MSIPNTIVKIGKKAKFKTLNKMFEIAIKKGHSFNFDSFDVEIYHDEGEFYCHKSKFGKEITIDSAEIEYFSTGKVKRITYYSKHNEFYEEELVYFSKFPKLTAKQIPEPKAPAILKQGIGVPNYNMIFNEDGTLTVGCQRLNEQQVNAVFKFLAKNLEYDLED